VQTATIADHRIPTPYCAPCMGVKFNVGEFQVSGGCLCCGLCPCCEYSMNILDRQNNRVGSIAKVPYFCCEFLTGTNRYTVHFPPGCTPDDKLLLIGATIHTDLGYFEKRKGNS